MGDRFYIQNGDKSICIDKNEGNIYIGDYVDNPESAFANGSYELQAYAPTISPAIQRAEIQLIESWIAKPASTDDSSRIGLLFGKAGIGKSIVMHDLLIDLQAKSDYLALGLKSDQIEFVNTEELRRKIHLVRPIEVVIKEMAHKYKRVVLLIDQIDALSLSLSSNRAPLRSLLKLIGQVKHIEHVRIVISCRPYDLEYDPLLDSLCINNRWELKEFSKEQVEQILYENHSDARLSENLIHYLGNPLHLYLFLKVKSDANQLTDPLSTDLLYHELWKQYITDDSVRPVEKNRLLSLLDKIVSSMYERQELSVHIREYETEFDREMQYLFTNGILLPTKNGQVQFFHQSLFDYVFSRRFTENGNDLLDVLKKQHQGLFSRAAVKSILSFQRELNPQQYISTIEALLYAKDENGSEVYRYHLKSLALSNMAFFEKPIKEELTLIRRRVFSDRAYMNVIFESVHSTAWFKGIWNLIEGKGGWRALSTDYKDKVIWMCKKTLLSDASVVLETMENSLDYNNEEDCQYVGDLLQCYELKCDSGQLIAFYNKLVKSRNPLEFVHLLHSILRTDPDFVCNELKENIRLQLLDKEVGVSHSISISFEVEHLYDELLKNHHDKCIRLLIDILTLIYETTQYLVEGSNIIPSSEFICFQRASGQHFMSNFAEDVANIIIDDLLADVEEEKNKSYIELFSRSKYEGFVFIALYLFSSRPDLFTDDVYDIIIDRDVLSNAPCWVEYQAIEALKATFNFFTDTQKVSIIDRILSIQDLGEKRFFSKEPLLKRLKLGRPILDIDLHKGRALEVISKSELRRLSWPAYQERQRIDRKFNEARLKNTKPASFSTHSGWTSLSIEQGQKMSEKTWLNSMLKYNNDPFDWKTPSLNGQCELFREVVRKNPDKYLGLINEAINHKDIVLAYPQAGMQGLLDAGRIDEAERVLQGIILVINNDVNSTHRGFSILSLLFAISDFIKRDHIPETVFQLLCNTLINVIDPPDIVIKNEAMKIYEIGMNQARGNAGFKLIECAHDIRYKDEIFNSIELIAETASVYTRAAILLNMAALNHLDKIRNITLFKKLLHDFNPRLMAMPVHSYNPLVYFVNYAVDEMMDLFKHAAKCPECYREQVIILWIAWAHNNREERVKEYLDIMCDNSQEARISLMNFLGTINNNRISDEVTYYLLHLMEPQFDSQQMGEACDNLFHHIKTWPEGVQAKIAGAYASSPLSSHRIRTFIEFLAGYAIKDPVQTLIWLEQILNTANVDGYLGDSLVDVIIQSYNGIKQFNDNSYQGALEHAMDLIDTIMRNPNKNVFISNFIYKLDNE